MSIHAASVSGVMQDTFACAVLSVQVGAVLQQKLQHDHVGALARVVERRLAEIVDCINVSAVAQQQANDCDVATETCSVQSNLAVES